MASHSSRQDAVKASSLRVVLSSLPSSVLVGVFLLALLMARRSEAVGSVSVGSDDASVFATLIVWAVVGSGLLLLPRSYLRAAPLVVVMLVPVVVGAGVVWAFMQSGELFTEAGLSLWGAAAVAASCAGVALLLSVVFDSFAFVQRAWLVLQAVVVTLLLGGSLLALLLSVPAVVGWGDAGAVGLAVVVSFLAVRVGRNALFGVEEGFLRESTLSWVVVGALMFAASAGFNAVHAFGVDALRVLLLCGGASAVWYLVAFLRQRPALASAVGVSGKAK